ncbi:Hypothetical_protein [Hexamita inflata]|uniref:Hypothetical_protein n=1 Tax=Hexamita inflata TaxID=28002 RepID=A0AA86TSY8_9EUKA|nr:Hypothetical protein HINF_LOCUS8853 [Hexamita inflata]
MKYLTKLKNIKQSIQNEEINILDQPLVHISLTENDKPLKKNEQIFQSELVYEKINEYDKKYIAQYVQKHKNLTVEQTASFLSRSNYFKGKDISKQYLSDIITHLKLQQQDTIDVKEAELETQARSNTELINEHKTQIQTYIQEYTVQNSAKADQKTQEKSANSNLQQDHHVIQQISDDKCQILQNQYTQIYKAGLFQILQQDYSQKTPKELCQLIQQLTQDQKILFWQFVQSNFIPQSSMINIKQYYKSSYQHVMYTDTLSDIDKEEIIKRIEGQLWDFKLQQLTQLLMQTQFKQRDIFPQQVLRFIANIKYSSVNKNNKTVDQPKEQDTNTKFMKEAIYKANISSQTVVHSVSSENKKLLKKNEFKPKLISDKINTVCMQYIVQYVQKHSYRTVEQTASFLSRSNYFKGKDISKQYLSDIITHLKLQQQETINNVKEAKQETQVGNTDFINEDDKAYIDKYIQEHKQLTSGKITQYIIKSRFKRRQVTKQQLIEFIKSIRDNNQNQTEINDGQLEQVHQVSNYDELNKSKNTEQQKLVLEAENMLFNNQDEIKSQIFNAKNNTLKKKQLNFKEQAQQQRDYFTILYKQSLNQVLKKDFSNQLAPELYQTITSLDSTQSQQFWDNLVSLVNPQRSVSYLILYFKSCYFRVQFTQILNINDRQEIQNIIQSNPTLTRQQIQELLIQQFSNRDICPKDIKKYLSRNYKKFKK